MSANNIFRVCGSSYTNWSYTKGNDICSSQDAQMELKSFSSGDALNLYEKIILNSSWQIIDGELGSTFVLARPHMFYTPNNSITKTLQTIGDSYNEPQINDVKRIEKLNNPMIFLDETRSLLINMGVLDVDQGVMSSYKKTSSVHNRDESVYDLLSESGTKRVSDNHFAISNHNLIFQEISVDDNIANTVKMDYSVLTVDNSTVVSILPIAYDLTYSNPNSKTVEKVCAPIIEQIEGGFKFLDPKTWFGNGNEQRQLEYLQNELLNEIRWCYQGKIFITHNPHVKAGDTITLLDNINSCYGKFVIDSYEHIFDSRGLITILSVKACFDIIDPALDLYLRKIALELSEDVLTNIASKEQTQTEKIALKNLLVHYNKIHLSNYRYGKFYHFEETDYFDNSGAYPEVKNSKLANPLAIRFIPFSKKGKLQVPDSLKSAFYHEENTPFKALSERMTDYVRQTFTNGFRGFTEWTKSTLLFVGDFALGIATLGLHELFKAWSGYTANKASNSVLGTSNITNDIIDVLKENTDYSSWGPSTNYAFRFGFFNVQAQKKTNLTPGVNNDNTRITFDNIKNVLATKQEVIKKIISDNFDMCGTVEMYDSFKIDGSDFTINDFIENVRPNGYSIKEESLFTNSYGEEKGVLFYDISKAGFSTTTRVNIEQTTKTFSTTSGDTTRNYIETVLDLSHLGYKNNDGDSINKIYFIWFHNIFGKTDLNIDSRISNIKDIIQKYGKLAQEDQEIGVVIMGDHNIEVVNKGMKPRGTDNINLFLDTFNSYGFKNYMTKPTTLSKNGQVTGSIYENVLLSPSLIANKEYIDINRVVYPFSGDKSIISDHVPAFVGFKKRT
ncbi:MAG: hypothetical protein ACRCX2_04765 [Paraclostridium sp.]